MSHKKNGEFARFLIGLFLAVAVALPLFAPIQVAQAAYVNVYGNTVRSPARAKVVPVSASARCRDGSYSFSQSRRGTCSHHGGVSRWLAR